jgi:hypothetical protein
MTAPESKNRRKRCPTGHTQALCLYDEVKSPLLDDKTNYYVKWFEGLFGKSSHTKQHQPSRDFAHKNIYFLWYGVPKISTDEIYTFKINKIKNILAT